MERESLYSESEVAEIVRRAAELQEQGSAKGYVPGITQDELKKMASEVGIEPAYLERAIADLRAGHGPAAKSTFRLEIERVLPVEIRPENFDLITDAVRIMPATTTNGVTSGGMSQVGRSLQGQVSGGWDNPFFKISSRGGRTKLNVTNSNGTAVGLTFLWIVPLCLAPVAGALGGAIAGGLAALACVAGAFLSFKWLCRKGHQATREAAQKLEEAILGAAEELDVRNNLANASTPQSESESEVSVREES